MRKNLTLANGPANTKEGGKKKNSSHPAHELNKISFIHYLESHTTLLQQALLSKMAKD